MADEEMSLSQRIAMIEQEYDALLQKTLEDVAKLGVMRNSDERKLHIRQILDNTGDELEALRERLGKSKKTLKAADGQDLSLGPLYHVPVLHETGDLEDIDRLSALKRHLLEKLNLRQTDPVVLQGPSGSSATSSVIQLARDPEIRAAFPKGIFWFRLGHSPDIIALQNELIQALGGEFKNVVDVEDSTARLKEFLSTRECLVILDEVYEAEDVTAFNVMGENCQWIVVSAVPQLFEFIQYIAKRTQKFDYDALTAEAAQAYLLQCGELENAPAESTEIIELCDGLPVAIRLATAAAKMADWSSVVARLKDEDCIISEGYEDDAKLLQALHVCLEQLGEPAEYYLTLGVFGDYTNIPRRIVLMLWAYMFQLSDDESGRLLQDFADKGLLQISGQGDAARIQLQAFHAAYMHEYSDLDKLHVHILSAYRKQCQQGWIHGPNDGYFFRYLPMHLHEAGRQRELKPLLLDFDWIQRKMNVSGLHELMYDYSLLEGDPELALLNQSLFAIAPAVTKDPDDFASELLNKLYQSQSKEIQALVNQAKEIVPDWVPSYADNREMNELDNR